jgi:hypothetical protein
MSTTSKHPAVLNATDEDITMLLAAQAHIGTKNCDKAMEPYVWKRRADGSYTNHYWQLGRVKSYSIPLYVRHPHHQRRKNLGEDRFGRSNYRSHRPR